MSDKKLLLDISSFSVIQMFNNSKGKTSLSYVCAFLLVVTGCGVVCLGAIQKFPDALLHGVALCGLGSGLLGIRRFTQDKEVHYPAVEKMKNENEVEA